MRGSEEDGERPGLVLREQCGSLGSHRIEHREQILGPLLPRREASALDPVGGSGPRRSKRMSRENDASFMKKSASGSSSQCTSMWQ